MSTVLIYSLLNYEEHFDEFFEAWFMLSNAIKLNEFFRQIVEG